MKDPRSKAAKIINEELKEFPAIQITETDLWWRENDGVIYPLDENNFIKRLFDILAPRVPFGTKLFHYIPLDHALFALGDKRMRMYFIEKYFAEDPDEYSGLLDDLEMPDEVTIGGEKQSRRTEDVRRNSYILSMSDSAQNESLWSKSTKDSPRVCLEVQIEKLSEHLLPEFLRGRNFFELRKVNYNRRIESLIRITARIQNELGVMIILSGIIHLALYTKSERFNPERECRFGVNDFYLQNIGQALSTPQLSALGAAPFSDESNLVHLSFPLIGLNEDRIEYPKSDFRRHFKRRNLYTFRLGKIIIDENISKIKLEALQARAVKYIPQVTIEMRD